MGDVGSKDEPVEEDYEDVRIGLTDTPGRRSVVGSELIALELAELSAELAKLSSSGAFSENQPKELASSPGSSRSWHDVRVVSDGRRRMPRHAPHRSRTHSAKATLTRHVQGSHATLSVSRVRPRARPRSAAPPHNVTLKYNAHRSVSHHVASLHVTSSEDEHTRGMGAEDSDGSESSVSSTKENNINLQVEAAAFAASNDFNKTIQTGNDAEVPPMGQFLLPLITGENYQTTSQHTDNSSIRSQLIQHKRILEALVSEDEAKRNNFIQEWKEEIARSIETERIEADKESSENSKSDHSKNFDQPENFGKHEQANVDQHNILSQPLSNSGLESIEKLIKEFNSLDMEIKEISQPSTSKEQDFSDQLKNSGISQKSPDMTNSNSKCATSLADFIATNSFPNISDAAFKGLHFLIRTEKSRKKGLRKKSDFKSNSESTNSARHSDSAHSSDSTQNSYSSNTDSNCDSVKDSESIKYNSERNSDNINNSVSTKSDSTINFASNTNKSCTDNILDSRESEISKMSDSGSNENNTTVFNTQFKNSDFANGSNAINCESMKNFFINDSDNADTFDPAKNSNSNKTNSSKNFDHNAENSYLSKSKATKNSDASTDNLTMSDCANKTDSSKTLDNKTENSIFNMSKSIENHNDSAIVDCETDNFNLESSDNSNKTTSSETLYNQTTNYNMHMWESKENSGVSENKETENLNLKKVDTANKTDSPKTLDNKTDSSKSVDNNTETSNLSNSQCLTHHCFKDDLPSLIKAFSSIDTTNLEPVTEEISSDYENNPETKVGCVKVKNTKNNRVRLIMFDQATPSTSQGALRSGNANPNQQLGQQMKGKNGHMLLLRDALGPFGVRTVSLRDVAAVLHYVFHANCPPPLDEIKLISTEGFSHQWRQYYESCSILTSTSTSRQAGLSDPEWHLRLQYGRCYCCVCMFRIHNRCAILDYADFIVMQLVMGGRQTTVDAVLLLRLLELNTPNKEAVMTDYGRKCEYVMTLGTRLVGDSVKGTYSVESTRDDLQSYYHRRPPVRKVIRDHRQVSAIADHVSELGLGIMASRLMEFMSLDHRLRDLLERGCCCRPFVKVDLPPANSILGEDGTCKWALEAMVNIFDGFSYQDTRALFKMEIINVDGDPKKVQRVNDSLRAGYKEWERRFFAKLYSQFTHRPVDSTGPIVECSICRCLCRARAVFNSEYRAGVTDSRLMQSMKESLFNDKTDKSSQKYGMKSLFEISMPKEKTEKITNEMEINSYIDPAIRELITSYFVSASNSQYDRIYNIERNPKKLSSMEKKYLKKNSEAALTHRATNDLCEASLEQVFITMESIVNGFNLQEVERNGENPNNSDVKRAKRKGIGKKAKSGIAKGKSKLTQKITPTQEYVNILQIKDDIEVEKSEITYGSTTFEEKLKTAQNFMEAEIRDMIAKKNIPVNRNDYTTGLDYTMEDLHIDLNVETAQNIPKETEKSSSTIVSIPNEVVIATVDEIYRHIVSKTSADVLNDTSLDATFLNTNTTFSSPNTTFSTPDLTFSTPNTTFSAADTACTSSNTPSSTFGPTLSHNSTATTLTSTSTLYDKDNENLANCTIEEIVNDDKKVERMIKEATASPQNIENVVNALLSTVQGVNASIHEEISRDLSNLVLDDEEIEILHNLCENCHIEIEPNEGNLKKCKECIEHDKILIKYLTISDNLAEIDVMHEGNLDAYAIEGNVNEMLNKSDSEFSDNDFVDVEDEDFDQDSDGDDDLTDMINDMLRTVKSIEVVMDKVMDKCCSGDGKLDMSKLLSRAMDDKLLALLDDKLIELYRQMPAIHKRQVAVYKRLEMWSQFTGQNDWPECPPPTRTPPPPPKHRRAHSGQSLFAVCPGYHVARFREVRRKLTHMIEQQKYFDNLRKSLEKKLTPPRKKSPENTNGNPISQDYFVDISNLNEDVNDNSNFEYVNEINTNQRLNSLGNMDKHLIKTVECSTITVDSANDMSEHSDTFEPSINTIERNTKEQSNNDGEHSNNNDIKHEIFAKISNYKKIKRNPSKKECDVAILEKSMKCIAEDVKIFESTSPIASSSSNIARATDTLQRLCQIVDRAKEIGVFQKEVNVNEHAKRVVEHGKSVLKRGEIVKRRTEISLDEQIKECIEANLAVKPKINRKALKKSSNKKSDSQTKIRTRLVEKNTLSNLNQAEKVDIIGRSAVVDRSSEIHQCSEVDVYDDVDESCEDKKVIDYIDHSAQDDNVSEVDKIFEVNQCPGFDQCCIYPSSLIKEKTEVAQISEIEKPSSSHQVSEQISAVHLENKHEDEAILNENNQNRRRITPIITMHSMYHSQSPSLSQNHMDRVMNCARRMSVTKKTQLRKRVIPCNSLIPIKPLHTGPFEGYKSPYMLKSEKKIENVTSVADIIVNTTRNNIVFSDTNGETNVVTSGISKKQYVNESKNLPQAGIDNETEFTNVDTNSTIKIKSDKTMIGENITNLEKIQAKIEKYQKLHSEHVLKKGKGICADKNEKDKPNSEESLILKRFLLKVNDLSQKYMVMKSNEVDPPEMFRYSERDEVQSDPEIYTSRFETIVNYDESVLSPPLQEISPIKNDVAIKKNMKIAFNMNLTKVKRKVAAFSRLLYQSAVMVERITSELAACDQIPSDLNLDVWIRDSECDSDNEFIFLQKELNELDLDISTIEYDHNENVNYNILLSFGDELKKAIKECLSVLTENPSKCDFTNVFCVHGIVTKSSISIVKNIIDRNEDVDFSAVQCIMVDLVENCLDLIEDVDLDEIDTLPSIQTEISDFLSAVKKGEFVVPEKISFDINSELKDWNYYMNDSKPWFGKVRTRKSPPKKNKSKKINEELRTILFSSSNLLQAMNKYIEKGEIERFKDSTYTQKEYNKWIANFSSYIISIRVFNYIGVLYKNYLKASKEGRLRLSLSNLMNMVLPKDQWIGSDEFTPGFKPEDASRQINIWLSAWRKFVMYKISGPEIGRLISENEREIKSSILKSVAKGRANSKIKDANILETSIRIFDEMLEDAEDREIEERSKYCQTDTIENVDYKDFITEKYCVCSTIKSKVKNIESPEIEGNSPWLDCFIFGTPTSQTEIRKEFSNHPRIRRTMSLFWDYIDIVMKLADNPKIPKWILENPDSALKYIQNKSCLKDGLRVETNLPQTNSNTDRSNALYFMEKLRNINMRIHVNIFEKRKLRLQYHILCKKLIITMNKVWALLKDSIDGKPNISIQTCFGRPCDSPQNLPIPCIIQPVIALVKIRSIGPSEAEILAGKGLSKMINGTAHKKTNDSNEMPKNNVSDSCYNGWDSDNDDKFDVFMKKNNLVTYEFRKTPAKNEKNDFKNIYIEEVDTGRMFFKRYKPPVSEDSHLSENSTIHNTEIDSDDGTDPDILEITDSDDDKDEYNEIKTKDAITPKIIKVTSDTQFVVNEKVVKLQKKMHVGIEVIHESHSTQTDLKVVEEKIEELCKGIEAASVSHEKFRKSANGSTNGVQKVTSKKSLLLKTVAKQMDPKTLAQATLDESKQKHEYEMAKYTAVALRNAKHSLNAAAFESIQSNTSKEVSQGQNQGTQTSKDQERSVLGQKERPLSKQQPVMTNNRCETLQHHVICKAGHCHTCPGGSQQSHVTNGVCTCCYCTVFGRATQAPTNHSSVSSKLGETRERLRNLLHKKRQNFKAQGLSPPPGFPPNSQIDISEQMSNMNLKECSSRHSTSSESSPGPDIYGNTVHMALGNVKCQILPAKCHMAKCKAPVRCQCQLVKTKYQHNCSLGDKKCVPSVRPGTSRVSKAVLQRKAQGLPSPRAPPTKVQQSCNRELNDNQNMPKDTNIDLKEIKHCASNNVDAKQVTTKKPGVTLDAIKKTEEAVRKTEEVVKIMEDAFKINDETVKNPRNAPKKALVDTMSKAKPVDTVKRVENFETHKNIDEMKRNLRLTTNSPVRMDDRNSNSDKHSETNKCIYSGYTRVPIQPYSASIQNQPAVTPHSPCPDHHSYQEDFPEPVVLEDTRDLNELLEYIEGPIKGVPNGKKKAKKARQKAKKVEQRLMAEQQDLSKELVKARKVLEEKRVLYESAQTEFDEIRRELRHQQQQLAKKKGKSKRAARPSPTQQAQIQTTADNMGKLTVKLKNVGEVYFNEEREVSALMSRLASCNERLRDVRREIGEDESDEAGQESEMGEASAETKMEDFEEVVEDMEADPPLQHEEGPKVESLKANSLAEAVKTLTAHAPADVNGDKPLVVTIRRGQEGVTLTWAPSYDANGQICQAQNNTVVQTQQRNGSIGASYTDNKKKDKSKVIETKPSWESAIKRIQELAKPVGRKERKERERDSKEKERDKDNKKKKSKDKVEEHLTRNDEKSSKKKKQENKNTTTESHKNLGKSLNNQTKANIVNEEASLTKKQRKQLLRQQAEEALMAPFKEKKAKEDEKLKSMEVIRTDKKGRVIEEEYGKNDKGLSKGAKKLQKQQLNSANHQILLSQSKQQAKTTKDNNKNKHKEDGGTAINKPQSQPMYANPSYSSMKSVSKITNNENTDSSGCSIMEQLSCGIQVADLRLPPGITLTRVDPNRQTTAKPIPSKPASDLINPIPSTTLPPSTPHLLTASRLPTQPHAMTGAGLSHTQTGLYTGLPHSNVPHAHLITGLPPSASQAYMSQSHLLGSLPRQATGHIYAVPNVVVLDPRSKDFEYQSKIHIPDAPPVNCPKGRKGKKKGKKPNIPQMEYHQTKTYTPNSQKTENVAPKMVTLKNPMFFSNQPSVFSAPDRSTLVADGPRMSNPINSNNAFNQNNMPTAPNCQATITPTANGMYTIRNPMMQLLHKNQNVDENATRNEELVQTQSNTQNYASIHDNYPTEHGQISINPIQSLRYTQDSTCQTSPKRDNMSNTLPMKNYEGYSLFKNTPSNDSAVITANPANSNVHYFNSASDTITTGYGQKQSFSDPPNVNVGNSSVFSDIWVSKVEPIGTPPKKNEELRPNSYYTPFGTDRNLRSAIFQGSSSERQFESKAIGSERDLEQKSEELGALLKRLTVGSHLNDEVTIHSVTESKFYKPGGTDIQPNNNGSVEITLISNNNQSTEIPYQTSQNSQPISSAVFNRSSKNGLAVGNIDVENVNTCVRASESLVLGQNSTPSSMYESNSISTSSSDSPAVFDGQFIRAIGEKPHEMSNLPIGRRSNYESTSYANQRTQDTSFSERNRTVGLNIVNDRSECNDLSIAAERLRDLTDRSIYSKEHQNFKDMGLVSERSLYGKDYNENIGMAGEQSIYSTDFQSKYNRDTSDRSMYSEDLNARKSIYAKDVGSERLYSRDMNISYGNEITNERIYNNDLGFNTLERTPFNADLNERIAFNNDLSSNLYGSNSGYTISGVTLNQDPSYGKSQDELVNSYASHSTSSQRMLLNGLRRSGDANSSIFYGDSVFAPNQTITNLNELDSSERDIETFKRFDFYFDPPKYKPKINLNVQDIALQLGRTPTAKDNK